MSDSAVRQPSAPQRPPVVDAHVHFWDAARGDDILVMRRFPNLRRRATPADLRPLLDASLIDRAVIVQAAPSTDETRYLLSIARELDWIAGVVGWVDLHDADVGAVLAELAANPKFRGVRAMLHRIAEPDWIADAATARGLATLARHDVTLDVTAAPHHLEPLLRAFRGLPELRVVVDHGGTPAIAARAWDDWAPRIAALARDTSVRCKLSGLVEEAAPDWTLEDLLPYAAHLLHCFGPARIIAASNWPVVELAGGHRRWWTTMLALLDRIGLDAEERAQVLGGTAATAYRI